MKSPRFWHFGSFKLDSADRLLLRNGEHITLSPKAFDLLAMLVRNGPDLSSRKELFQTVWRDVLVEDSNLTNNITHLRKILGPDAIQTVPKYGYRFRLPVTPSGEMSQSSEETFRTGQAQMLRRTAESVQSARNLFWLVIGDEPDCAPAWAWLARASRFLEKFGVEREYHRRMSQLALERALTLEPNLGFACQLQINMQVDRGEALNALQTLLNRLPEERDNPSHYAALVQVCRFCGLLSASKAAHRRAKELNSETETSIPHTYFADCNFQAVVEAYAIDAKGSGVFLDVSAWATLGFRENTEREIIRRLESRTAPAVFGALLRSLLLALQGKTQEAEETCSSVDLYEDPETALYFARHLAFCGSIDMANNYLGKALDGGLAVPVMLQNDPWLQKVRTTADFGAFTRRTTEICGLANHCLQQAKVSHLLGEI